MASGGRLCVEAGVSGALMRLMRLVAAAGAFAASLMLSLAPPIEASPKDTCSTDYDMCEARTAIMLTTCFWCIDRARGFRLSPKEKGSAPLRLHWRESLPWPWTRSAPALQPA